ncbi:sulfatase family protein [Seonamhaeicola maritimus]|uniref:Sulfatase n=1 Tax=Seonamhaeicola maritimus TaxID=2591822 RepID=A0A5C7GFE3_9FLAO|nr:sulfatase [Seonamhaeicola maritimus]TXG35398.1 sulfatase [Seonamhaeicola maritimus]
MKRLSISSLFIIMVFCIVEIYAQDEKPNILWLTSEDNSAEWIGCYGNSNAETPNIDALAKEGFQYMNTFANAPVCAPQRSTWITGVMAISMGTHPMRSSYKIPHNKIKYYPDFLNENGYYTGNFAKKDYNIGGRNDEPWDNPKTLNWETLKQQQPFFQVINFQASHESRAFGEIDNTNHDPNKTRIPEYHPDIPDIRKNYAHYHDAIKKMDSQIGDAIKNLEKAGLAENTIVVYVSDHGGVLPRSKRYLFKNSLHCPLVIRIPEKYKKLWPADEVGAKIDRLVSFVDMPKTWLSITGSEVPDYMQGNIFLGADTEKEQEYHFAFRGRMDERFDNARAVSNKRYLYIRNYMPYLPWMQYLEYLWRMKATQAWEEAVKKGDVTEVQSRFFKPKGWTEELYDMHNDPDCVNNLIDNQEFSSVAVNMRVALREKQIKINDAGLLPESEMARLAKEANSTIYEVSRNQDLFNIEKILNAADLALDKNPNNLSKLRAMLESNDLGERYWGIVGCFLLNDKESGFKGINDESHEVQAMAAWILTKNGEVDKGVACIRQLIEQRSYALLTALNMVEWIGESGEKLIPAVKALDLRESYKNQYKYQIRRRDHLLNFFGEQ